MATAAGAGAFGPTRIIVLPALPLTPHGKIDRVALASLAEEEPDRVARQLEPPRTPIEQTLASIWAAVLRIPR